MSLDNQEEWDLVIEKAENDNPCIIVAQRVMELLDTCLDFICDEIITQAAQDTSTAKFTKYQAAAVTSIVFRCHSKGEEFQNQWNLRYKNAKHVFRKDFR